MNIYVAGAFNDMLSPFWSPFAWKEIVGGVVVVMVGLVRWLRTHFINEMKCQTRIERFYREWELSVVLLTAEAKKLCMCFRFAGSIPTCFVHYAGRRTPRGEINVCFALKSYE